MERSTQFRDTVLTLAGIGVILALMRMSAEIIVPFLLALFIVIIAATPLQWMKRRGISTVLSVLIVIVVVIVVIGAISSLLGNTVGQFSEALPEYKKRLGEMMDGVVTWLRNKGVNVDEEGFSKVANPSVIIEYADSLLSGVGGTLSNALLILFTMIFMLSETAGFPKKLAAIEGEHGRGALVGLAGIVQNVNRYASAKAVVSFATGLLIWIALEFIGLDFAPLWGFLAFMLNFVPNIGSILAAVPAVLIAILQLEPVMVLAVIGVYVAVNVAIGNIIEPMIMGHRVGLSTLVVFMSLVFWGWMFGGIGMLLSVPLSMVVKSVAEINPQTRWFAILMSPAPGDAEPGESG